MINLSDDLIEEIRVYKRFIFLFNILVETTKLYIDTVDKSKFLIDKKQNQNLKFCFEKNIWALSKDDITFVFDRLKYLELYECIGWKNLCLKSEINRLCNQNLGVRYKTKKRIKYNAKLFMRIIDDPQVIFSIYDDFFTDEYDIDISDFENDFQNDMN